MAAGFLPVRLIEEINLSRIWQRPLACCPSALTELPVTQRRPAEDVFQIIKGH